jgi:hypothetical protein
LELAKKQHRHRPARHVFCVPQEGVVRLGERLENVIATPLQHEVPPGKRQEGSQVRTGGEERKRRKRRKRKRRRKMRRRSRKRKRERERQRERQRERERK